MKLIVGLGNPGSQYEKTRHNLGFMVLDDFLKNYNSTIETFWEDNKKLKSSIAQVDWNSRRNKTLERVILAKPKTYMNNSGLAVSLIASFYKVKPSDILIIHDDIDLPLGNMKIRQAGSAAGHRGVESVIDKLGTDKFWRMRLGIGFSKTRKEVAKTKMGNTTQFVLRKFSGAESSKAKKTVKRGVKALEEILERDFQSAMNQFNTK